GLSLSSKSGGLNFDFAVLAKLAEVRVSRALVEAHPQQVTGASDPIPFSDISLSLSLSCASLSLISVCQVSETLTHIHGHTLFARILSLCSSRSRDLPSDTDSSNRAPVSPSSSSILP